MDGRRNFLKTAFATCSLLAGSKLLTACTPIKRAASEEEETFETFATPNALKWRLRWKSACCVFCAVVALRLNFQKSERE